MGWLKHLEFIGKAEFGLATGSALTALAFGNDPALMSLVLLVGWLVAVVGIASTSLIGWRLKIAFSFSALIFFVAEGWLLYDHANPVFANDLFRAAITWFNGTRWALWILSAAIGFLLRGWITDGIRKIRTHAALARTKKLPVQKGFLDYQMDINRCARELGKVLGSSSNQTARLGQYMAKQTPKIAQIAVNIRAGKSQERMLRKAYKIAAQTGSYMDAYCIRIEAFDLRFATITDDMIVAIDWLATNQENYGSPPTLASLGTMGEACHTARTSLGDFNTALKGLRGVEASMNQSCDRAIMLNDRFMTTMERMESLCVRVVSGAPLNAIAPV